MWLVRTSAAAFRVVRWLRFSHLRRAARLDSVWICSIECERRAPVPVIILTAWQHGARVDEASTACAVPGTALRRRAAACSQRGRTARLRALKLRPPHSATIREPRSCIKRASRAAATSARSLCRLTCADPGETGKPEVAIARAIHRQAPAPRVPSSPQHHRHPEQLLETSCWSRPRAYTGNTPPGLRERTAHILLDEIGACRAFSSPSCASPAERRVPSVATVPARRLRIIAGDPPDLVRRCGRTPFVATFLPDSHSTLALTYPSSGVTIGRRSLVSSQLVAACQLPGDGPSRGSHAVLDRPLARNVRELESRQRSSCSTRAAVRGLRSDFLAKSDRNLGLRGRCREGSTPCGS